MSNKTLKQKIKEIEKINKNYPKNWYESNLSDNALMPQYLKSESTTKEARFLKNILFKHKITDKQWKSIFKSYAHKLVKAGTKGNIRGKIFNFIVFEKVNDVIENCKNSKDFKVEQEKHHPNFLTSEVPDFWIYNKKTNKLMVGMNQIDMWSGGQQKNRLDKYLKMSQNQSKNIDFVCVIAKKYVPSFQTSNLNNKTSGFNLMYNGLINKNIVYYSHLEEKIKEYFKKC